MPTGLRLGSALAPLCTRWTRKRSPPAMMTALRGTRRWALRLTSGYVVANAALALVYPLLLLYPFRRQLDAREERGVLDDLSAAGLLSRAVRFRTKDGLMLRGWTVQPAATAPAPVRTAIVLIHGRFSDRREMVPYARFLAGAGYLTLLYDRRGQGQSDPHPCTYGMTERRDVRAAIEFLRRAHGVQRIGLLGVSLGAATALQAAPHCPEVRAVVADSSFADLHSVVEHYGSLWGWNPSWLTLPARRAAYPLTQQWSGLAIEDVIPERDAARLEAPALVIHGARDIRIPPEHARRIFDRLGGPRQLWLVPGAGHGAAYATAAAEYQARVLKLFAQHVRV